ncbi:YdgA family protein [Mannheimia bovis]|uniref:YdgA family protein n=1 Tax=Mannheimia bovis TaxID=2770636 RepID=UPI0024B7721B|nr:YdgA family protein [Mannheimia bovis]WHP46675.1 YdgA family protein [Mannheimia bovis]
MKLSKIALSVVAVIGVSVVGGSWYTGKQVEEKYQALVVQANNQLKQLSGEFGANIELKDVQIDRHFFSSDAKYRLEVDLGDGKKLDFIGNDKLHHGPLPLNRLAKFNFAPVMMSMENSLQGPEIFKKFVGEQIGSGVANISYSGDTKGYFDFSPIKYSDETGTIETTPLKVQYSYDQKLKGIDSTVELENFKIKAEELDLQIQGIAYDVQTESNESYPNLTFGKGSGKINAIEFKSKDGKLSQIKDIVVKGDNLLKGERVISTGDLEAASFNIEGVELGKLKMDMAYDLDAKLTNDITPLLSSPEGFEDELLMQLLAKSVKFHINNFSLENSKGKFNLALLLNMAQFDPQNMSNMQEVLKALSSSKFTSNINREYAEDIIRQISMVTEKLSEEEAKAFAKQQVDAAFLNAGVEQYGLRKVDENNVKIELSVENEKLILNGRELTEDEIQMALFVIMMGAGSLGQ